MPNAAPPLASTTFAQKSPPPIYPLCAQSPGHNKLFSLHPFHTCETTSVAALSGDRSNVSRVCGGGNECDNRESRWTKGHGVMPGSRASSFQRQATPPPRPVIPRETKSDQPQPSDTVWSKVGRPSGAARVPASLALQHPRGTRRDVSRKRNKPSPPTRCAIRRNRAQSSKGITARTRSESPNQSKTLANRERFFARTSQPTCPNPKHTLTGHNYPKNKEASALAPASLFV